MPNLSDFRRKRHSVPSEKEKQQPCVPVQFVVIGKGVSNDDSLDIAESLDAGKMPMFNGELIEVEQIGAVLYVRSK